MKYVNEIWRQIGKLEKQRQHLDGADNKKVFRDKVVWLELVMESSRDAFPKVLGLPFSSVHPIQITLPLFLHLHAISFLFSKDFATNYLPSYVWRLQYKAYLKANTREVLLNLLIQPF